MPTAEITAPSSARGALDPPVNGSVDDPAGCVVVVACAAVEPCVPTNTVDVGAIVVAPRTLVVVVDASVVGVLVEEDVGTVVPSVTIVVGSATVVDVLVEVVEVLIDVVLVLIDVVLVLIDVVLVLIDVEVVDVDWSGAHEFGSSVARTSRFLPGYVYPPKVYEGIASSSWLPCPAAFCASATLLMLTVRAL